MKANLFLALFLLVGAASNGCQDTGSAAGQEASSAKLAEDMSTRPASRRWFWWGGEPEPAAPADKTASAGQG